MLSPSHALTVPSCYARDRMSRALLLFQTLRDSSPNLAPVFVYRRKTGAAAAAGGLQPERLPLWRRLTVRVMERTGLMARVQQAIRQAQ